MSNSGTNSCDCGCGGSGGHNSARNLPGLSALQYRFGTHGSLKRDMLHALAASPALQRFTTRKDDDFSIGLADAWASVLDVLSFYQERVINEGYLRTATDRFSIVELSRHISYRLRPGVAAGGYLSFTLNEAPGAPPRTNVPAGTKVQSIPAQNELPQLFETSEPIEARVEWNALRLQTRRFQIPVAGDTSLYLDGISTGLQTGDAILIIGEERVDNAGNERWDFRKISTVTPDPKMNRTRISWERGLGISPTGVAGKIAAKNVRVFVFRQKAALFGYNAPDFRAMSESVKDIFNPDALNYYNLNADWKNFSVSSISGENDVIHLEAVYSKILPQSWVVLSREGYQEVYKVLEAAESSRQDFTIATKTTALRLSGENLVTKFDSHVRDTIVFGQSDELMLAATPVDDAIQNQSLIRLEKLVQGLRPGMPITISGQRKRLVVTQEAKNLMFVVSTDNTASRQLKAGDTLIIRQIPEALAGGKIRWLLEDNAGNLGSVDAHAVDYAIVPAENADTVVSEVHIVREIIAGSDPTLILLEEPLLQVLDSKSVSINANVAAATHGESKEETLGSGNGSAVFQKFALKQKPLTYISAATATGAASTLEIRVNDVRWTEVSTLFDAGPRDKVFATSLADDGTVVVQFGDGITGARLPTGIENVRASYRVGIGTDGILNAGQLSMLMTPQLGISKVQNPVETTGAADPERLDRARTNAPLTVLTLDRIVSVQDFQDYARAFAGIGKSVAEVLWNGEQQIMHITVASEEGPIPAGSGIYVNLLSAIRAAAHPHISVQVSDYELLYFSLNARIKVDPAYLPDKVQADVVRALLTQFSFSNRAFGQSLAASEPIAVIQGVPGVIYADLDLLNGQDPFSTERFRLPALAARWSGANILPAQLLLIDPANINLSAI